MAEVQPLSALRYDTSVVSSLADVTAPPYDVISPQQRDALLQRSEHNIVAIDLPLLNAEGKLEGASGDASQQDPYAAAGERFARWQQEGVLRRDPTPAFWVHTQEYTGPDGIARTRRGFFCRVRIEEYGEGRVRPHERTHPGPKEDRLKLMRATQADLSPIFSLYSDPGHEAWDVLAPGGDQKPDGEVTDADGTVHRIWRADRPEQIAGVSATLKDAELLIADGHHRYETAKTYAEEVGGEGDHRYILMCLVALEDPGLTVFPTHRLVSGLDDAKRHRLLQAIESDFDVEEVSLDALAPQPGEGPLQLGLLDSRKQPLRLTLKDQQIADEALKGHSDAYRRLDTGVLEALLLKGALGLSEHDIAELNGLWYARDTQDAISLVQSGEFDAAFLMRPTPISHVREVAASGENMPPKSTYFFPKLLTGLLINPLA
ncbi:MAG TPA: DUF1015 domain-containing protein [Solirubrobacteraceae bacterium]|jgi:uncharacterized protein (DUF1015 family)